MDASALEGVPELYRTTQDAIAALRALLEGRAPAAEIVYTADALYRIAASFEEGAGKILAGAAGLFVDHDRQRYVDGWHDGQAALLTEQAAAASTPRLRLAASG
jgi:hypothetical protein